MADGTKLVPVDYRGLTAPQKEIYNFQKIAARLADFGYNCLWLSDDWQGADFLAVHLDGETVLRVQLKGRPTISQAYLGKGLHIAYRHITAAGDEEVYLYPHDLFVEEWKANVPSWTSSQSWATARVHWGHPPAWARAWLAAYRLQPIKTHLGAGR